MNSSPFNHLSLREKIGQTCQIHGKDVSEIKGDRLQAFFSEYPVGSIFLGSEIISSKIEGAEQLQKLIADCQTASRIPLSVAGDLENGSGGAIHGMTAFPNLLALGAVNDPAAAYEYGRWTALEATRVGFNWSFGPVVDLSLNWLNPAVNIRSLGQAQERVAELAAALIRGSQEHGLSATAKHFPGDGVDFRDQHFCVSTNSLSEEDWQDSFGHVYEVCFGAGVHAVMAGHIALPWMEPRKGTARAPLPATASRRILDGLLREKLGFEGVVVSDALIMAGFRGKAAFREDLIIEAFNAGIDVMLWPGSDYLELMERAVERGRISMDRLDQSVKRIWEMKARQGLFTKEVEEKPKNTAIPVSTAKPLEKAGAFAEALAQRSLTLVENRRGLLPLHPAKIKRVQILLATPKEAGAEERMSPLLQGLKARGMEVAFQVNGNCLDLRAKEAAGERYDALIAIFELSTQWLKNTMRPTGPMAECMWTVQGLETMNPIVVSLGSPYLLYDMPWAETYLNTYSPNSYTLRALERALFGEIPFEGVSPVRLEDPWTVSEGKCPHAGKLLVPITPL
jgi:beta-N-acetylhexosaminidase